MSHSEFKMWYNESLTSKSAQQRHNYATFARSFTIRQQTQSCRGRSKEFFLEYSQRQYLHNSPTFQSDPGSAPTRKLMQY
jgi:hypothetical protein